MRIIFLICSAFLFLALAKLPIGYYTFLRIVVTVRAVAVILTEIENGISGWIILFGLIAITFNPIFPVYLNTKAAWIFPDLFSAISFLIKSFFIKVKPQNEKD